MLLLRNYYKTSPMIKDALRQNLVDENYATDYLKCQVAVPKHEYLQQRLVTCYTVVTIKITGY